MEGEVPGLERGMGGDSGEKQFPSTPLRAGSLRLWRFGMTERPLTTENTESAEENLSRHFLQQLLVNVEVGVDVLHVVVFFEGFDEANHGRRL
jgi:hypothetical protein